MAEPHADTALIPYLRGELADTERGLVERHLEECSACRERLRDFRSILEALRAERLEPPALDPRRYRAELRTKLERRTARRAAWLAWRLAPVAATAFAALALVLTLTLRGGRRHDAADDLPPFEQAAIGSHLELLENYRLLENLDVLEEADLAQDADGQESPGVG